MKSYKTISSPVGAPKPVQTGMRLSSIIAFDIIPLTIITP